MGLGSAFKKAAGISSFGLLGGRAGKDAFSSALGGGKSLTGTERFKATESPFRGDLSRALEVLKQRTEGARPSVAEEQLQQGLDQNLMDFTSAIRSAPGLNPALQARLIGQAQREQGGELARAQAVLRAGEQAQAEQTLLSGIGQGLGADMGMQQLNQAAFEGAQGRRGGFFREARQGLGQILGGMGGLG